jgi:hypothetical protein
VDVGRDRERAQWSGPGTESGRRDVALEIIHLRDVKIPVQAQRERPTDAWEEMRLGTDYAAAD